MRRPLCARVTPGGFVLVEAAAAVLVCCLVISVLLVSATRSRRLARLGEDLAHLRQIGQLTGAYGKDNADRYWTFSWTTGPAPINPSDPAESVLDREFYPSVFAFRLGFFLILVIVGGLLVAGSAHVRRRQSEQVRVQEAHPNQPWMWRADWAAGVIRSSRYRYASVAAWIFAVYLLVILPVSLWIIHQRGNDILSVPGIVVIVLAWGLFNLARMQLKGARMFRSAEFRMSSVPGLVPALSADQPLSASRTVDD